MRISTATLAILCGGLWMSFGESASAQNVGTNGPQLYAAPVVSPYLNLAVMPNGLSNYQTLVQPMIEERDDLLRQSANLQRLQQQMNRNAAAGDTRGRDASGRSRQGVRFMDYSHYYGGLR